MRRTIVAATAVLAGLLTGCAGSGDAHARLHVSVAGAVRNGAAGLSGTVTIRNLSAERTGHVAVQLRVRGSHAGQTLIDARVGSIAGRGSARLVLRGGLPDGLAGRQSLVACAGSGGPACQTVGRLRLTTPTHSPSGHRPIAYFVSTPEVVSGAGARYWLSVPASYDPRGRRPMKLLLWLHGCNAHGAVNIYDVTPDPRRDYVAIADDQREGMCYQPKTDTPIVFGDLADVERHLAIDPRQVILGGDSSGGDLGYRIMFQHADRFAGFLALATSPFHETELSPQASLAAARRRFPVVQLSHLGDMEYTPAIVHREIGVLQRAGYPVKLIMLPGDHFDTPGENGFEGTYVDFRRYLLPHVDDGWRLP